MINKCCFDSQVDGWVVNIFKFVPVLDTRFVNIGQAFNLQICTTIDEDSQVWHDRSHLGVYVDLKKPKSMDCFLKLFFLKHKDQNLSMIIHTILSTYLALCIIKGLSLSKFIF